MIRRSIGRRQFCATGLLLAAAVTGGLLPSDASAAEDLDAPYDALLARYVRSGADGVNRVDYAGWHANAADRRALDAYIKALEARRPSAMPRGEAFAYWGNLYNALTLKLVVDRYPIASIRDIRSEGGLASWLDYKAYLGPWRQPRSTVEGKLLSLDDIEHKIMRPTFKDPRVHYVVNCASYGCPNLKPTAWRAATLEADLTAGAKAFVNHPRGATVMPDGGFRVSSIYKWFIEDFGGNDAGVLEHLRQYASPPLAAKLAGVSRIASDSYDWSLNRTGGKGVNAKSD